MMLQNVQDGWLPARFAGRALRWLWFKNKPVTITVVLVVGVIKIRKYMKKQERRKKWNNAGKDVVVLHIPSRGFYCPSLSPFVVKLETYIRMAEIPHVVTIVSICKILSCFVFFLFSFLFLMIV
ncbi:uncharacterized protein LOC134787563, partial [Penaeus indicus]|uniref:uncharacterized protein LOC134787563 n=1 Tax=Penaeus indicus TaxID=29960 RepID=UPI00300D1C47